MTRDVVRSYIGRKMNRYLAAKAKLTGKTIPAVSDDIADDLLALEDNLTFKNDRKKKRKGFSFI